MLLSRLPCLSASTVAAAGRGGAWWSKASASPPSPAARQVSACSLLDSFPFHSLLLFPPSTPSSLRIILETDPTVVATRVTMRTGDEVGSPMAMDNPGLQSLSLAFGNVKEQLARSLLK